MRCATGQACHHGWAAHPEGHRHLWPIGNSNGSSGSSNCSSSCSRRPHRQRPSSQRCAAIEQDMGTSVPLRSLAQHGLLDVADGMPDSRGVSAADSVPLRKRINRMIKKVGSLLELRVLLEQESLAFDAVNTSSALHKLARMHTTLQKQLSSAGMLSPEAAAQQRSEHVAPCLEVLDALVRGHVEQMDAWGVAMCMWSYATLDHYDRQLFDLLCGRALPLAESMKPVDCANILQAFGKWGHYHPELLQSIPQVLLAQMYETKPQEVSQVLWGFGRLRVPGAPGRAFLLAVCEDVQSNMHAYGNQELTNVLWALVKLQFYPGVSFLQRCEHVMLQRLRSGAHLHALAARHTQPPAINGSSSNGVEHHHAHSGLNGSAPQQHHANGHDVQPHVNGWAGGQRGLQQQQQQRQHTLQLNFHHQDHPQPQQPMQPPAPHLVLKPQDIGNLLWAFGKLRYKAAWLLDEVPLTLGAWLHLFSPVDLCCLLAGYANARHFHKGVLEAVAPLMSQRVHELGLNELMTVLWSYGIFQHQPSSEPQLFNRLASSLAARVRSFRPQTYAVAAKACANLQYRPEGLLPPLIQGALARLPDFKPEEMAHLLYGLSYLVSRAPHCELPGVASTPPSGQRSHGSPARAAAPNSQAAALPSSSGSATPAPRPGRAALAAAAGPGVAVAPEVGATATGLHPALRPEEMQLFYAVVRQCIRLLDEPHHPYASPRHLNHQVLNSIIFSCLRIGYTPWALIDIAETKGFRVIQPQNDSSKAQKPQQQQQGATAAGPSSSSSGTRAAGSAGPGDSQSVPAAKVPAAPAATEGVENVAEPCIEVPPKAHVTRPRQARRGQHAPLPPEFDNANTRGRRRLSGLTRQRQPLFDRGQAAADTEEASAQLSNGQPRSRSSSPEQMLAVPQRPGGPVALSNGHVMVSGLPLDTVSDAATRAASGVSFGRSVPPVLHVMRPAGTSVAAVHHANGTPRAAAAPLHSDEQ